MRLVKDRLLYVWEQRCAEARDRTAERERRVKAIHQKLDRLEMRFCTRSPSTGIATAANATRCARS